MGQVRVRVVRDIPNGANRLGGPDGLPDSRRHLELGSLGVTPHMGLLVDNDL
jgi:hypothetical protein